MTARTLREPQQLWQAHKPRRGDLMIYHGEPYGVVTSLDGALCWVQPMHFQGEHAGTNRGEPGPFIWCFRDGLNKLHDWPAKHPDLIQESADGHGTLRW